MSTPDNGGPAFPTENEHQSSSSTWHYEGMTLRDYFAAKAMQGIVQLTGYATPKACKHAAECAYAVADAMLKAREA